VGRGVHVKDHWNDDTNGSATLKFSNYSAEVSIEGAKSRGVHWSVTATQKREDEVR